MPMFDKKRLARRLRAAVISSLNESLEFDNDIDGTPIVANAAKYYYVERIREWMDLHCEAEYVINDDLTVDVDGDVKLCSSSEEQFSGIPDYVRFNRVSGNFSITSACETLEGCPIYVGGEFKVSCCNKLRDLKGSPMEVGACIVYGNRRLESLAGAPAEVARYFKCSNNNSLRSLEKFNARIGAQFFCESCDSLESLSDSCFTCSSLFLKKLPCLKSLDGCPEDVISFSCVDCPLITALKGMPVKCSSIYIQNCRSLETLEGCPAEVNMFNCCGQYDRDNCRVQYTPDLALRSLKGMPKRIKQSAHIDGLPILFADAPDTVVYGWMRVCRCEQLLTDEGMPQVTGMFDINTKQRLTRQEKRIVTEYVESLRARGY